jgi:hypothetical protein
MVELPSFNRLIRTMVDTLERAIRYNAKKKNNDFFASHKHNKYSYLLLTSLKL